jgi:hypothetical protein
MVTSDVWCLCVCLLFCFVLFFALYFVVPDPRLFEPAAQDVMRAGILREWSRLDAFKNAYLSSCKDSDQKPAARVLRNVNRAIDDEVVLKKIDAHECGLTAPGLQALVHALIVGISGCVIVCVLLLWWMACASFMTCCSVG